MTLVEFLSARIAEDDAAARGVAGLYPSPVGVAGFVAARVLAECEAKRQIVRQEDPGSLRALAAVYADHPEYRDDWCP